eukprot:TRINITY_DN7290_c0_g1_i1.p1 TRINITY_DN7290_c0_g1~~TRINITY_DN7290_c0_g1_i1.p1  ORF type:complete len:241 (-),score=79.93 TRINITY_DN7290_c0_g1_i1:41-733(-)
MRLTVELVRRAPERINPAKQMELDLRGYLIPAIENLGTTEDLYDLIDFSDNAIKRIENFPRLQRLSALYISNNRIASIATGLGANLPNLEVLIAANNKISEFSDLDPLAELPKLRKLSLFDNPVSRRQNYRLYVAFKLPNVKILDFRKIKSKEREEAARVFGAGGTAHADADAEAGGANTFVPGEMSDAAPPAAAPESLAAIKAAIASATSIEEVERLEKQLESGLHSRA